MSDQTGPRRVSVAEAAEILGMSLENVRRLIHQGTLKADRVQRGKGWSYLVMLDAAPITPRPATPRPASDDVVTVRDRKAEAPDQIDTTVEMLAAFSRAVAPLMTPLVAQLVDQAETIGRLRAEAAFRKTAPGPAPRHKRSETATSP